MKNKTYKLMATLGIFLGLAVVSVRAQAPSHVKVEIPFAFSAGKTTLPAGVYSIKRLSGDNVVLRSEDGKSRVILDAPVSESSIDPKAIERIVFDKYGDRYALSQIWLTAGTGRRVWTDMKGQKTDRVEIALRRNNAE